MREILITGGTGYLGNRLGEYLAGNGYRVSIFGRGSQGTGKAGWHSRFENVWFGDIRDPSNFEQFSTRSFDTVIHLVGMDYQQAERDDEVMSINTLPTWTLLRYCERHKVRRLIYVSTEKVFGKGNSGELNESSPPKPDSQHGLSHWLSEQIVSYFDENTPVSGVNLRLSNTYGRPGSSHGVCWKYVLNQLCKQAHEERCIRLMSDGSPLRDFIHIEDVCCATQVLIETPETRGTYHLASGSNRSILEVSRVVQRVCEARYEFEIPIVTHDGSEPPRTDSVTDSTRYSLLIDKIAELGFLPAVSLEEGIGDLLAFLEQREGIPG